MARESRLLLRLFCPARRSQKPGEPEVLQTWPRLGSEILTAEDHPGRSEARGHPAGGAGQRCPHQIHPGRSGISRGFRQARPTAASPAGEGRNGMTTLKKLAKQAIRYGITPECIGPISTFTDTLRGVYRSDLHIYRRGL